MAGSFCMIVLVSMLSLCECVRDEKFFKVPVDAARRLEERPSRLTDNPADPDMVRLKFIQDQFFNVLSNTSIGSEFKSFSQILDLVDSTAGKEVGKLLINGVMLGFAKENSNQLLMEFWDDFKYRLPSDFADALNDYKDFMKGVDINMVPMTLELLFKKDNLGNSLAQMPLGQLVDLVQPEASKYGIDIRGFIDGIIGKGNSKFPDMLRKFIQSFNISSIMKSITGSMTKDNQLGLSSAKNSKSVKSVNQMQQTLQLFKPFIARILRDNGINLDVDAVIQVMIPFVNGGGEILKNMMSKDGKGFDLSQLTPLLPLLGMGAAGGSKNDPIKMISTVLENIGGMDSNMAPLLSMASQFLAPKSGNKQAGKDKKMPKLDLASVGELVKQVSGNSGLDAGSILTMASQMMGANKKGGAGGGEPDMFGMLAKMVGGGKDLDAGTLLQAASGLLSNFNKPTKKAAAKRSPDLIDILEPMVLKLKTDTKSHSKIQEAFNFIKSMLKKKNISLDQIDQIVPSLIRMATGGSKIPKDINIDVLNSMLSFSFEEWSEFLRQMENDDLRENVILQATTPATQVIKMLSQDVFSNQQSAAFTNKVQDTFASFGIEGLTLDNFPEKLSPVIGMFSVAYDIPIQLSPLLNPLRDTLKNAKIWFEHSMKVMNQIPSHKMEDTVAKALDKDVATALRNVWKAFEQSMETPSCYPRAICNILSEEQQTNGHISLRNAMTRVFGAGFGIGRAYYRDNMSILLGSLKASMRTTTNCERVFTFSCPQTEETRQSKKDSANKMDLKYQQHLHDDL